MQKQSSGWSSKPRAVQLYVIAIVTLAAFCFLYFLQSYQALLSVKQLSLGLLLTGCVTLAGRFPVRIQKDMKVDVATVPLVAAALLFNPLVAMLVGFTGIILSDILLKRRFYNALFNASLRGTNIGLSSFVFSTIIGNTAVDGVTRFDIFNSTHLGVIPLIVCLYYSFEAFVVSGIIGLQTRQRIFGILKKTIQMQILQDAALILLGIVAAAVPTQHFWLVGLITIPTLVVYQSLQKRRELQVQTDLALERLADVVDRRDRYTFEHSKRVAEYSHDIAVTLNLPPDEVDLITRSARVHDVGKVGMPDSILLKNTGLTDEEYAIMKQHSVAGAEILMDFPGYAAGRDLVLYHHERMDGSGYPMGLKGEQIPLGARIIGVADSFDAMTSNRTYRTARSFEAACLELERCSGRLYEPAIVTAFVTLIREREAAKQQALQPQVQGELIPQPLVQTVS